MKLIGPSGAETVGKDDLGQSESSRWTNLAKKSGSGERALTNGNRILREWQKQRKRGGGIPFCGGIAENDYSPVDNNSEMTDGQADGRTAIHSLISAAFPLLHL
ncbi:hypothetical protein niasHS_013481 [Heterodera schachtii]|uniref:Uncharacterized protein n=1 Tax=Heterodera schachtii TaxID=97005 RepID=A0ABD2IFQ4_HETSC